LFEGSGRVFRRKSFNHIYVWANNFRQNLYYVGQLKRWRFDIVLTEAYIWKDFIANKHDDFLSWNLQLANKWFAKGRISQFENCRLKCFGFISMSDKQYRRGFRFAIWGVVSKGLCLKKVSRPFLSISYHISNCILVNI